MPVARAFADPGLSISNVGNSSSHSANDPTAETEEPIEEDKKYCTCFGAGIGDMVGCDGLDCPREWVSCFALIFFGYAHVTCSSIYPVLA